MGGYVTHPRTCGSESGLLLSLLELRSRRLCCPQVKVTAPSRILGELPPREMPRFIGVHGGPDPYYLMTSVRHSEGEGGTESS